MNAGRRRYPARLVVAERVVETTPAPRPLPLSPTETTMSGTTSDHPTAQRLFADFRWDELSHEQGVVLSVIRSHQGRAQAISVTDVAVRAGMSGRRVQEVVKELIEDHGVPIGSTSSASRPGWYLCVSDEERQANLVSLRDRALSILKRSRAFRPGSARLDRILGAQLPLPTEVSRG